MDTYIPHNAFAFRPSTTFNRPIECGLLSLKYIWFWQPYKHWHKKFQWLISLTFYIHNYCIYGKYERGNHFHRTWIWYLVCGMTLFWFEKMTYPLWRFSIWLSYLWHSRKIKSIISYFWGFQIFIFSFSETKLFPKPFHIFQMDLKPKVKYFSWI